MKKLINWIIHLLGGYTEEEYEKNKEKYISSLKAENGYRKLYFGECAKLNAEHENYLAMLSLHNTTVEQMQNNAMGVAGAIDTIKAYCKSKGNCDECALYTKNGGCKIHEIPCYWGNE